MLETILITILIAKLKGYNIKPLLTAYAFYPIFLVEIFGVFLQISIFMKNPQFMSTITFIKSFYMVLYIIPLLRYSLYKQGIIGSIFIIIGTFLNKIVMISNGGKMPVYPTLSRLTGYYTPEVFAQSSIHILGTSETSYKFLADWIDVGYSILSVGDVLIRLFVAIITFYSIKKIQEIKNG